MSSELRISPDCVDTDDGASIIFQFEGSTHRYKLPKPTVTLEMESVESGERVCDSAIKPFRSAEDQNARSSGHRSISRGKGDLGNNMSRIWGERDVIIVGLAFLRQHYTVFDNESGAPRIGFARATRPS